MSDNDREFNRNNKHIDEGKLNGKRRRGRSRTLRMDNIKDWTNLSYVDCARKADNQESWRSMIVNLLGANDTQ